MAGLVPATQEHPASHGRAGRGHSRHRVHESPGLTLGDDGWFGGVSVLSMISVANLHRDHGSRRAIVTASGLMSQA